MAAPISGLLYEIYSENVLIMSCESLPSISGNPITSKILHWKVENDDLSGLSNNYNIYIGFSGTDYEILATCVGDGVSLSLEGDAEIPSKYLTGDPIRLGFVNEMIQFSDPIEVEIPQAVKITCNTPGSQIRYTTDNTTPTSSSQLYSSEFTSYIGTTIKAIGIKSGWADSNVAELTI